MATFDSQSYNGRYVRLTVTESNVEPANNRSKVNWNVSVNGANGVWYSTTVYLSINGSELVNTSWIDPPTGSFPMVNGTSKSGSFWVSHGTDGKKTVDVTFNVAIFYRTPQAKGGTFALTDIDRTAPTVTQNNITNIGTNSFTISATSDVACNSWEYSLNNGSSWTVFSTTSGTSASTTVTGLTVNTSYTVLIRAKKTLNDVYGTSGSKTATTTGSSIISNASPVTLGNACGITWTPYDSNFKYKLSFSLGGWSYQTGFIYPYQTTPYTYTGYNIPIAVANQLPNATSGTMTATLTTFKNDGTPIGTPSSKTFTVYVPSSVIPSIDNVTIQEGTASGFNLYVKSLSTVKVTTTASGAYGSTITSIVVKFDNTSVFANSSGVAVSPVLSTAGTMQIRVFVTDSRGRTAQTPNAFTIPVYDYFQPTGNITITRYDVDAVPNVRTTVTGSIAPVNNTNAKSLVIKRKRLSDDHIDTYPVNPLSSYNYTVNWDQTISDIETESYEYTVEITDTKQTVTVKQQTAVICISRLGGGRGVTFFDEASQEGFWIWNIRHDITTSEYLELATLLAENFSTAAAYNVGRFCIYNSKVWECKTYVASGSSWNSSKWTELGSI